MSDTTEDEILTAVSELNRRLVSMLNELDEVKAKMELINANHDANNTKLDAIMAALIPSPELPNTNGVTTRNMPDVNIKLR